MPRTAVAKVQNLLTYSEQFDNAVYTKINIAVTPNSSTDPLGGNTADTITANGAGSVYHYLTQSAGVRYGKEIMTASVYLKAGTSPWIYMGTSQGTYWHRAWFNGSTFAVGNLDGALSANSVPVGNGWFRCSVTWISEVGKPTDLFVGPTNSNGGSVYTQSGEYFYAWGGQVVQANYPGPYVQTVASVVNTGNIRSLAQPVALVNKLVDGNMEATNAAVALVDGNMEAAGTSAWAAITALVSKQTGNPHSGTQCLRVGYDGSNTNGFATQVAIFTIGNVYHITGWARGDGTSIPRVADGSGAILFTGTSSTAWQQVDVIGQAVSPNFIVYSYTLSAGHYVEFDDITITDLTAGAYSTSQSVSYKTTTNPHSGSQALRVSYDGSHAIGNAYQSLMTVGKPYLITGWARGDGTSFPKIMDNASQTYWTGTASTNWQPFNFIGISTFAASPAFGSSNLSAGHYVDFDDIQVIDLTATPMRLLAQPYPIVNKLVDGNMEATNAAVALVDGNMELAGTASWSPTTANLSKDVSVPHGGTQALKVAYNGSSALGQATQGGIFTIGHVYKLDMWAYSDGTAVPKVTDGGTVIWAGTATLGWQHVQYTAAWTGTALGLRSENLNTGLFVEFDDIIITDVTAGAYSASTATLSKQTTNPHSGGQCLRIGYDGANATGYAYQTILTVGRVYRIFGWMRSDGTSIPRIAVNGGTGAMVGTTSTSWQYFDETFVSGGTNFDLYSTNLSATHYVEFDDVQIIDLAATPTRLLAQPYPIVNILVDGNMEATNAAVTNVNGQFVDSTNWQTPGPWSIGGGLASVTSAAGNNNLYQTAGSLTLGHVYKMTYTITAISSGSLAIYAGATGAGTTRTTPGTYTESILCSGDTRIYVVNTSNTAASLTNIVITDVTAGSYTTSNTVNSKITTNPHSGLQALDVLSTGGTCGARQNILIIGKPYLLTAWVRTVAGAHAPQAWDAAGPVVGTTTVSSNWQKIQSTFTAQSAGIAFGNTGSSVSDEWVWDDVQVIDLTANPTRQPVY